MDVPPFTCPYCEIEIQLPEDVWYYTCTHCGSHLDLNSQFAYLRGLDAFSEGQDIADRINPKKKKNHFNPRVTTAMTIFKEAYSSLQVALLTDLAESQRSLAVEMLASMSQEFAKWDLVSPLEMNYWSSIMVEQTAQWEYNQLKEKLSNPDQPLFWIKKMRWRARQKQLLQSLAKLDEKIKTIEKRIAFVDKPRARDLKWKPQS